MKVSYPTSKFYPCYPVFIVSYYDRDGNIRISTASSSYSLGNFFILGIGKNSFFVDNLNEKGYFSVNFLSIDYMKGIEICGYLSNKSDKRKTEKSGFTFAKSKSTYTPYIEEASLIFECKVRSSTEFEGLYVNVISDIVNRMFDNSLLEEGNYVYGKLNIPLFEGDSSQRVYRFLKSKIVKGGSYFSKI